ncbi:16S rRNA (uracil(1498)-N(3))-methyltransferase [Magnetospirillum sp. 64-120]|uniref:16S rRNA (uracil(1498)-N(3))-methyltransferase n=1 Tax=Magnetospirillum sp. 64-120 TaxID=1895778 RepID=UPI000926C5B8|nr:16S rRNA (uracil(1498)-N(3))-methyltransferase [Magnetospirillum sp. 64-120]OJX68530.1 MAG: 16S rRNA (uracil(1498)-N(3))-methyltransferase [Magnetospirillum sp. 64-120]
MIRLFVPNDLSAESGIVLDKDQSHYLANVMRLKEGEAIALFNGRDGEWTASLQKVAKSGVAIHVHSQTRPQTPEPDLWLLAAPIKKDRVDLVAEKAAELGVSRLWPVFTRRTVMSRVNTERLAANMVEAAEQCERLTIPEMAEPAALDKVLAGWDAERPLLFLDESGAGQPIATALAGMAPGKLAVLVGPEGGFDNTERALLARLPFAVPISLGPRILRAETAAIAALSVVQALVGDWKLGPRAS